MHSRRAFDMDIVVLPEKTAAGAYFGSKTP
jgi:hypothetical protein